MQLCFFQCRDSWIEIIQKHQGDLLPTKTVLSHKTWFDYVVNVEHPEDSRFRCRLCLKHFSKMNFPKQSISGFAKQEGVLKANRKKNQEALYDHARSAIHLNIISNLKELYAKKQRLSATFIEQSEEVKNKYLKATTQMIRTVLYMLLLSLVYLSRTTNI